jgi:hypothetical protein
MVKVYFESKVHAELVAIFDNESTYLLCLPSLEKEAKKHRMIVTESIDEEKEINELK